MVNQGLRELPPELRTWAETHLTVPRRVRLFSSMDSSEASTYWLVTDHTGERDSNYRVVYDERHNQFGVGMALDDSRELFMGGFGSFAETISNL